MYFKNIGYFLREVKIIFKQNIWSNILSIFSISLIFFIFAFILNSGIIINNLSEQIEEQAEMNVFLDSEIYDIDKIILDIEAIEGVRKAVYISEEEAYIKMKEMLGNEASVLEHLDENPFESFIEVSIELDYLDSIIEDILKVDGVEFVRDNKEILDNLNGIISIINLITIFLVISVGIGTLVIISHVIRQGIYSHREEINTLRLLGGPELFIGMPFIIAGILISFIGGLVSLTINYIIIYNIYNLLLELIPFVAFPNFSNIVNINLIIIIGGSLLLGLLGSLLGLRASKKIV